MVGDVAVGGDNPIRVQSMTTTLTKDVGATVDQAERLVNAGCEIVRVTTPAPDDARCLKAIREGLQQRGVTVPLVADIHFSPLAAMVAADYADKVRVNPGNYVDSRKFAVKEYSDAQYAEEVQRVYDRVAPLVLKCKERGISMRIGTNHGSLSDRIMNRFGDTPEGMVESALEFVRVCEANSFYDIILSMKASNPKVMIAAYRLLAARMDEFDMHYPFHLGVTEAGNDQDGRIKSAIGIGSLLEDGIGDTIRVSLTEEPEAEIPVAQAIVARYPKPTNQPPADSPPLSWDPYHYSRRQSTVVSIADLAVGGHETVAVAVGIDGALSRTRHLPTLLRWASPGGRKQPKPDLARVEIELEEDIFALAEARRRLHQLPMASLRFQASGKNPALLAKATEAADMVGVRISPATCHPAEALYELGVTCQASHTPMVLVGMTDDRDFSEVINALIETASELSQTDAPLLLSLRAPETVAVYAYRLLAARLAEAGLLLPILLQADAGSHEEGDELLLGPSTILGSLLCDGIGDAVGVHGAGDIVSLAFNILQAAGARISKTDYVACPSCGRTLFDLQETTERIKSRTSHLVGVRLAIMGCIVNGPGEMADADFGYVGGAPGKVNLYVGKECVEKGVGADQADDRLIALIKSHGKWQEETGEPEGAPIRDQVAVASTN